jgi:hypothetical protein
MQYRIGYLKFGFVSEFVFFNFISKEEHHESERVHGEDITCRLEHSQD